MKSFCAPMMEIQRLEPEDVFTGSDCSVEALRCVSCYCSAVSCPTGFCTELDCPGCFDYF